MFIYSPLFLCLILRVKVYWNKIKLIVKFAQRSTVLREHLSAVLAPSLKYTMFKFRSHKDWLLGVPEGINRT